MKKKILIGSMLVLTLLLLMPSIPAIQQKTIEDGVRQDLQEKLDTITLDDLKYIDVLDDIKHPILYYIFVFINDFRLSRFILVALIALDSFDFDEYGNMSFKHPILFIISMMRAGWLFATLYIWQVFWLTISHELGWNWF